MQTGLLAHHFCTQPDSGSPTAPETSASITVLPLSAIGENPAHSEEQRISGLAGDTRRMSGRMYGEGLGEGWDGFSRKEMADTLPKRRSLV
jgi:hypothetical protein